MKKYLIILLGLFILGISSFVSAQEQLNIMNAALPSPRSALSCAFSLTADKIYCFGGNIGSGVDLDQILEYNHLNDSLIIKSSTLPISRHGLACVESFVNNKIYCFGGSLAGGSVFSNQILEYNPQLDTINIMSTTLPFGRYIHSCAESSITNKIYCFGGYTGGVGAVNQIIEYNPANNSLAIKNAVLPTPRWGLSCAESSITNKIYCFAGDNSGGQITEYNPVNDTIIIKSSVISPSRHGLSCKESFNNIYCFGGYSPPLLDEILEYDPVNDTLNIRPIVLPSARLFLSCESASFGIYCFGGQISSTSATFTDQIVKYTSPNPAPILSPIGNQVIDENQTLTIQLSASDPENDTLIFSTNAASVLPSPFIFTQINNNEALFEWTPTFQAAGNYSVTFIVTDIAGTSDSETILIIVNQVNLPPILQSIGNQVIIENQQLTVQLDASDFDNDPLVFGTNAYQILPNSFSFNQNTGLFQWTPNYLGYGNYTVTFNVTDGLLSDEETIQINVNDAQTANLFYIGTPTPGNTINFVLGDSAAPSQIYILALALGNDQPIILSDQRIIPLNADGGFYLSLGAPLSIGLSNSLGFFNPLGSAISAWTIPGYLPSGLIVKAAYVSINPTVTVPRGIISISNVVSFTIN